MALPIGSGAVESGIRRVVNLRLKGNGIFWTTALTIAWLPELQADWLVQEIIESQSPLETSQMIGLLRGEAATTLGVGARPTAKWLPAWLSAGQLSPELGTVRIRAKS
jgi:hypothetical protein